MKRMLWKPRKVPDKYKVTEQADTDRRMDRYRVKEEEEEIKEEAVGAGIKIGEEVESAGVFEDTGNRDEGGKSEEG